MDEEDRSDCELRSSLVGQGALLITASVDLHTESRTQEWNTKTIR